MMLVQKYKDENPAGWWMSEKFDGVRALWTGEILVSKNGYKISAPNWFIAKLPKKTRLDGELWLGRGRFQEMAAIIRNNDPDAEDWREVKFQVFDVVADAAFELRQEILNDINLPGHVRRVRHICCDGPDHLQNTFSTITTTGGEGVVLRAPGSFYSQGYSSNLLKLKKVKSSEAVVIEHLPGKGKNARRLGTLLCRWTDGRKIRIGTGLSEKLRNKPPKIGSIVTFNYLETTAIGQPREARFVTVRDYE